MSTAPYAQVVTRARNIELLKKDLRHIGIVVLASVNKKFLHIWTEFLKGTRNYCSLDKLWPSTNNGKNFHISMH